MPFTSRWLEKALTSRGTSLRRTSARKAARRRSPREVSSSLSQSAVQIERGTKASDIQQHPVLGNCYRVQIRSTRDQKTRVVSRTSQIGVGGTPRAAITGTGTAAPFAIEDGEVNPKSSSESSSSSSSSNHKKRKRSKKDKKDKKRSKKDKKDKKRSKKDKSKKDMTDAYDLASQILSTAALPQICDG